MPSDKKLAKAQAKQAAADEKRAAKEAAEREKEAAAQAKVQAKRDAEEAKEQAKRDAEEAKVQAKRDAEEAKEQAKQAAADKKRAAKEEKAQAKQAAADEKRAAKGAPDRAAADERPAAEGQDEAAGQVEQTTKRTKPAHRATREDKRAAKKAAAEAKQAEKAQKKAAPGKRSDKRSDKRAAKEAAAEAKKAEKKAAGKRSSKRDAKKAKKAASGKRAPKPPAGAVPTDRKSARQHRAATKAFAQRRQRATVGIEVDGQVVRVVEVENGEVIWTQTYGPDTSVSDSIRQWLDDRPGKRRKWSAPTVTWAGPGTHLRMIEVPAQAQQQELRPLLLGLVQDDIPMRPGTYQLAAAEEHTTRLDDVSELGEIHAVFRALSVTAVDQQPLAALWQVLHDTEADFVPAEYTLGTDGLMLAVRNSKIALALCRGGVPVAARDLPVGGVDTLAERLTASAPGDRARLDALLRGETPAVPEIAEPDPDGWSDPGGEPFDWDAPGQAGPHDALLEAADVFVSEIASEVRASVGYWQRQGLSVPSNLTVFGPGAELVGLSDQLDLVGLRSVPPDLPEGLDWGETPSAGELAYHGAVRAASGHADLLLEIENPLKLQELARERTLRRRGRRVAVAGLAIIAAGWFLLRPYLEARVDLQDATEQREELESTVARLSGVEDQVRTLSASSASILALTATEPEWQAVLSALQTTGSSVGEFLSLQLGLEPCDAESSGAAAPEEVVPVEAAPDEEGNTGPAAASLDTVACIDGHMEVALPEAQSPQRRLASLAAWLAGLEALGGAEVWPSVVVPVELDEQGNPVAAQPETPSEEGAGPSAESLLGPDPASLTKTGRLTVAVDLLLPSIAPYRTPREAGAAASAGGEQNG